MPRGNWEKLCLYLNQPPPPKKKTKRADTIEKSLENHLGQSETWQYNSKKDFEYRNGKMGKMGKMCDQGKWQKKKKGAHRSP